MIKHTNSDLAQMQSLPLSAKVQMTKRRIREWYEFWDGDVYVSLSGGKDSTVLLHIVRELYPDVEAAFVDTGLEYPEIRAFVKTTPNVTILKPKMRFDEVIKNYGYPVISKEVSECVSQGRACIERNDGTYCYSLEKLQGVAVDKDGNLSLYNKKKYEPLLYVDFRCSHMCCNVMKKAPAHAFTKTSGKKPFTGQMAQESALRKKQWLKNGCNGFEMKSPVSNPLSFWTEQDVLQYIVENNVKIASVYGDIIKVDGKLKTTGADRTGCVFCAFGAHMEKESRFKRLKETHPNQYKYCIWGGEYVDGVWMPNSQGLGMGHVFDELNKLFGEDFIDYD